MQRKINTSFRSAQGSRISAGIPVDLHAERMILSAALRCGSASPLGDLTTAHFFDEWHKLVVAAIQNFSTKKFSISELAATLPVFVRPYLQALAYYQIFVLIRGQSKN